MIPSIPQKIKLLDANILKIIAVVTMLIDHTALAILMNRILLPAAPISRGTGLYRLYMLYKVLRGVGRTAFPIFCFMLAEGFYHTKDRQKYALRLLIAAIVSEVPFDLAFYDTPMYTGYQNVCFTLLLGFLLLWEWEYFKNKWYIQVVLGLLLGFTAWFFKTDYSWHGVLLIFIFYLLHDFRIPQLICGAISMLWEWPSVFSFILLLFYNGKKGHQLKYFFYIFYPAHLFLLWILYVRL